MCHNVQSLFLGVMAAAEVPIALVDVVAERQGAAVLRAGAGAGLSLKVWSLSVEWASLLEGRCSDEQERDAEPRQPPADRAPRARGRGRGPRGPRGRRGRGRGGAPGGPEEAEDAADILGEMLGEVMEHSDGAYDGSGESEEELADHPEHADLDADGREVRSDNSPHLSDGSDGDAGAPGAAAGHAVVPDLHGSAAGPALAPPMPPPSGPPSPVTDAEGPDDEPAVAAAAPAPPPPVEGVPQALLDQVAGMRRALAAAQAEADSRSHHPVEDGVISLVKTADDRVLFLSWTNWASREARVVRLDDQDKVIAIYAPLQPVAAYPGSEVIVPNAGFFLGRRSRAMRPPMPPWLLLLRKKHTHIGHIGPVLMGPGEQCVACPHHGIGVAPAGPGVLAYRCGTCLAVWHNACVCRYDASAALHGDWVDFVCPACASA